MKKSKRVTRWVYRDVDDVCRIHLEKNRNSEIDWFNPRVLWKLYGLTPRKGRWERFTILRGE